MNAYGRDPRLHTEAKKQWMLGFMEQGINSLEMIEAGLRRARASESDFLPSVGKIRVMVQGGDGGVMRTAGIKKSIF